LITGAGSGIGRAIAKAFAAAGCSHLVLVDRNGESMKDLAEECRLDKSRITIKQLDIRDDNEVEKLIQSIPQDHGSLDYALNVAGIIGTRALLHEADMKDIDDVLNINLRAQILMSQVEVKMMLSRDASAGPGVIINIASLMGKMAARSEQVPAYTISKHGVIGLAKYLARTYGGRGIRSNAICPGYVDTPMISHAASNQELEALKMLNPQKRLGRPEEIADLALFLCSDAATFINGSAINIDGGYWA